MNEERDPFKSLEAYAVPIAVAVASFAVRSVLSIACMVVPDGETAHFDCDHVRLPYHLPVIERIALFLRKEASAEHLSRGWDAFKRTNALLEHALPLFIKSRTFLASS